MVSVKNALRNANSSTMYLDSNMALRNAGSDT